MIADIHKPDISTLVRRGHFYFGWTQVPGEVDNPYSPSLSLLMEGYPACEIWSL
jgi:hypothetical protein